MSTARRFVSNAAMTAAAIGYKNADVSYIADQVLPRTPVATEKFKWLRYDDAEAFTSPEQRVGRKGRVNEVEFSASEQDGSVETYGLQTPIPKSDIDAAAAQRAQGLSTYDPRLRTTSMLTNLLMLGREIRVAAAVQASANFDAGNITTLAAAPDRFDVATGDPEAVINTRLSSVLMYRPNTCAMSREVWDKMRRHPGLVKKLKGSTQADGMITREEFASYFEITRLLIGEAYGNTAKPGQAMNLSRVWGKHISFLYLDSSVGPEGGVTWGYSPVWGSKVAGTMPDEDIGLDGGEVIRVGERINELVVCKSAGALILNAIS